MKKTISFFVIAFLISGSLAAGCSSKKDSKIDLDEQERTRQHKKEFEQNAESNL